MISSSGYAAGEIFVKNVNRVLNFVMMGWVLEEQIVVDVSLS